MAVCRCRGFVVCLWLRDAEAKCGYCRVETGRNGGSVIGGFKEEGSIISVHQIAEVTAFNFDP